MVEERAGIHFGGVTDIATFRIGDNELVRIVFAQVSNSLFKGKHTFHTQTFVESQVRFVSYTVIGCSIDDCLVESEDRIFFRK